MNRANQFYDTYIKRMLDFTISLVFIVFFCWLYLLLALIVRVNLGSPVIFKQHRPGKKDKSTGEEKIFYMYKFRSMTDDKDTNGNPLPDEDRLTTFGKALRATSLDELPEMFNILKGDMSLVGPRPQLVRDMVFMSEKQRNRHNVRPGLSGLAQVNGRNAISWERKLDYDIKYINDISLINDLKIIVLTIKKVFVRSNITESSEEIDVTLDYGDWLLEQGKVSKEEYDKKQKEAKKLLET